MLGELATPPRPIHALYPSKRHLWPKVRSFLDFLTPLFAGTRKTF